MVAVLEKLPQLSPSRSSPEGHTGRGSAARHEHTRGAYEP